MQVRERERNQGQRESLGDGSVYVCGRRNSVSLWEPGVCGSLLISMLVSDDRHVFDPSVISEVCMDKRNSDITLCVLTLPSTIPHLPAHNPNTKEHHFIY